MTCDRTGPTVRPGPARLPRRLATIAAAAVTALAMLAAGAPSVVAQTVPRPSGSPPPPGTRSTARCALPAISAHRGGDPDTTESTTNAFAAAFAAGVRIWDTDVRFTSSGYGMLLHDPTLHLFGSNAAIARSTWTYAKSLRAPKDGAQIMSLYDFAQMMVLYPSVTAQIELKIAPTAKEWAGVDSNLRAVKSRVTLASSTPRPCGRNRRTATGRA